MISELYSNAIRPPVACRRSCSATPAFTPSGSTVWPTRAGFKRHPTIGNNVVIGSGAKVLGPFAVGENSRIGSGSVVVKEVPPNSVVVGVPGRITHRDGKKVEHGVDLNMTDLPDPVAKTLQFLMDRVMELECAIEEPKRLQPPASHVSSGEPDSDTWRATEASIKRVSDAPGESREAVRPVSPK